LPRGEGSAAEVEEGKMERKIIGQNDVMRGGTKGSLSKKGRPRPLLFARYRRVGRTPFNGPRAKETQKGKDQEKEQPPKDGAKQTRRTKKKRKNGQSRQGLLSYRNLKQKGRNGGILGLTTELQLRRENCGGRWRFTRVGGAEKGCVGGMYGFLQKGSARKKKHSGKGGQKKSTLGKKKGTF